MTLGGVTATMTGTSSGGSYNMPDWYFFDVTNAVSR